MVFQKILISELPDERTDLLKALPDLLVLVNEPISTNLEDFNSVVRRWVELVEKIVKDIKNIQNVTK